MKKQKPIRAKPAAKSKTTPSARAQRSRPRVLSRAPNGTVSDTVAINPADFSGSMRVVLDAIKFKNQNRRILIGHSIGPTAVGLLFQPI